MTKDMKDHLPKVDTEKIAKMYAIKLQYEEGKLTLEEMRAEMKRQVGEVRPEEFALMEQTYTPTDDADSCRFENMDYINKVFDTEWSTNCPDLEDGHPIKTYYAEDLAIKKVLKKAEELLQGKFIKNQWLEIMEQLQEVRIHYSRKQNQLYPALERKGFMHPSTTMWTYDDFNRDNISSASRLLDEDKHEEFLKAVSEMIEPILDLIDKEERILFPTSLSMISEEEFRAMRSGDDEIGYCLIEKPVGFRPKGEESQERKGEEKSDFGAELQALLEKHGYAETKKDPILDVATGKLTLEQINLIYKYMPVDLSFVDEDNLVKFYTDTKHRVFPRSSGVIGREVKNCHPPKSVHVVEEIIEKFRSGEKDNAEFWINKPDIFIYILYVAVRDEKGRFRGVLEMMQDCTHIRSLKDSQVLLNWEEGTMQEDKTEAPKQEETPQEPTPSNDEAITTKTKISSLIKKKGELRKRLAEIDEQFKMIQNPILYNTVGQFVTIADMADKVGRDPEELLQEIIKLYDSI